MARLSLPMRRNWAFGPATYMLEMNLETATGLLSTSHEPASPYFSPRSQLAPFPVAILVIKQKKPSLTVHTLISGAFQTLSIHHHRGGKGLGGREGAFDMNPTACLGAERPWLSFLRASFKFQHCDLVLYIVGLEDRESIKGRDYVLRKMSSGQ